MRFGSRFPTLVLALALSAVPIASHAASHREAPLIAQDPAADITDVYAFRNYDAPDKVTLIMNVIPAQEPSAGPNYFFFDDSVRYRMHVDLNRDGIADDLVFEIRFKTELRNALARFGLRSPVANVGRPEVGQITALDGAGSEGLGIRQSYSVTMIRKAPNGRLTRTVLKTQDGERLYAVPSNQGPLTMPNYEALAAQGVRELQDGIRVFAGQRDETFYIDLGAVFDGPLNLRPPAPLLTDAQDADDANNFGGVDMFSGFNVSTIAIEVPKALVTPSHGTQIGIYASTSRPKITVLREPGRDWHQHGKDDDVDDLESRRTVQVARMANPLVNELLISFGDKDRWNRTEPEDEHQFLADYRNPALATVLNLLFAVPIPATPRDDLVGVLLRYPGPRTGRIAELLRLDLAVPATAADAQRRLTVLAHDAAGNPTPDGAGWPNGRRPNDDVTDIALRVVSGVLLGTGNARLGDGVNFNIGAPGSGLTANGIARNFPFLPTPHDGRNRRHIDPGE